MFDISIRKLIQMGLSYEPSVPCALIIWLARAVNVVRPVTRRLHIDRARFARERTALRKARLECACLVQESGQWSPRHLLGLGAIVQAWLELRIQIQTKWTNALSSADRIYPEKTCSQKGNVHGIVNMANRCAYQTEQTAKDNLVFPKVDLTYSPPAMPLPFKIDGVTSNNVLLKCQLATRPI